MMATNELNASVMVYRERRSRILKVQAMCRPGRYGLAEYGPAVPITSADNERLRATIESALDSFATNMYDPGAPGLARAEQARFLREHDAITVDRTHTQLRLTPLAHIRGGFEAMKERAIMLDVPFTAEALA